MADAAEPPPSGGEPPNPPSDPTPSSGSTPPNDAQRLHELELENQRLKYEAERERERSNHRASKIKHWCAIILISGGALGDHFHQKTKYDDALNAAARTAQSAEQAKQEVRAVRRKVDQLNERLDKQDAKTNGFKVAENPPDSQ